MNRIDGLTYRYRSVELWFNSVCIKNINNVIPKEYIFLYIPIQLYSFQYLNNFSHSTGCLFTVECILWCIEVLKFWCSSVYFCFSPCTLGVISMKSLPRPVSWSFSLSFLPTSHFVFKKGILTAQNSLCFLHYSWNLQPNEIAGCRIINVIDSGVYVSM